MRYILTKQARADLKSIARYSKQEWGEAQAKRYVKALKRRYAQLVALPELGAYDTALNCRRLIAGEHSIFYRIDEKHITILRILHQSMDAPRWLVR